MQFRSNLIDILLSNKDKIIASKKYTESEFEVFIAALMQAEKLRYEILEKIKIDNEIDVEKLAKEFKISRNAVGLNLEYLKEAGLLEFVGEVSEFYRSLEKKNDKLGVFPTILELKERNLCSGCGLCVSTCPTNAINFTNDVLEIDEGACIKCGLCYACCHRTFFPNLLNDVGVKKEKDDKFLKELNYYKEIYTAQTNDEQIKKVAQDGGVVTSLLKTAFLENLIDTALVVGELKDEFSLKPFPYLAFNEQELLNSGGTKYSNAHLLKILQQARARKSIAVVGTPCTMQALKKVAAYPLNKPLFDNIWIKIGIFCMESFDHAKIVEILKSKFQKKPEEIRKMNIHGGRFIIYDNEGKHHDIPIKNVKEYGRYGCFLCSDLTAEHADISIGFIGSDPDWSTVIIRSKRGLELFQKSSEHQLIKKKLIKETDENFTQLRKIARSKMKFYKEIPRQKMIEQDPVERSKNFLEVPQGLTPEMVRLETLRCLQCGNPSCIQGCPVNVNIPEFIRFLKLGKYNEAAHSIKQYNLLPAICGRVCPQEIQCEEFCLLGKIDKPVAIGYLERFIADWERKNQLKVCPDCRPPNGIKVAVIGSGPAGLTCAADLVRLGYEVTIFEAFHEGGGVLVYGIPEFRLPKEIVKDEIETVQLLGVKIKYNAIISKLLTIEDLEDLGFKAIFIGVGAGLPQMLRICGIELNGVLTANEFLTRTNLMKAYRFPEYDTPIDVGSQVTVIGGGNVAVDSARAALRLGAKKVTIIYRRTEVEMPARKEEIHHAKEEGINFMFLTNPMEFIGDVEGNVKEMVLERMKLGEPDESGRRSPVPIEKSNFTIDTDMVIIAIGTSANTLLLRKIPDLKLTARQYIMTDEDGRTNIENVFAGGDIVTGSATVISAMGAGRKAAKAIDQYLIKKYKDSQCS